MSQNSLRDSYKPILKIAGNLTIASLIAGIIIASIYLVTEPFIVKNRIIMVQDAMHTLMPHATSFTKIESQPLWYTAWRDSLLIGYIINVKVRGYGGAIAIIAAADTNGRVLDYNILSHNETPGLGDLADKPKFKNQFKGKKASQLSVAKIYDPEKINAITGATITSLAVTTGIKNSLIQLEAILGN